MYLQKGVCIKKLEKKKYFLLASGRLLTKRAESGAGSVSQRYGSEDPDPHQNVTDLEHWLQCSFSITGSKLSSPKPLAIVGQALNPAVTVKVTQLLKTLDTSYETVPTQVRYPTHKKRHLAK